MFGDWTGLFKATNLELRIAEYDFNIDFKCSALDPCLQGWVDQMKPMLANMVEQERKVREAKEKDELHLLEIPAIAVEGMLDGIATAIAAGTAYGGLLVIDKLFMGIDYGMQINEPEEGEITIALPDKEIGVEKFLEEAEMSIDPDGSLILTMPRSTFLEAEGYYEVDGKIEKTSTGARLSVNVLVSASNYTTSFRLGFTADMIPGIPDMGPLSDKYMAEFENSLDNPPARVLKYFPPLDAYMDKLGIDPPFSPGN